MQSLLNLLLYTLLIACVEGHRIRTLSAAHRVKSAQNVLPLWASIAPEALTEEHLLQRCGGDDGLDIRGLTRHSLLGKGKGGSVSKVQQARNGSVYVENLALKIVKLRATGARGGMRGETSLKNFVREVAMQEQAARIGLALPVLDAWACELNSKQRMGYFLMPLMQGQRLDFAINSRKSFNGDPITEADDPVPCKSKFMLDRIVEIDGEITARDESLMIDALTKANEAGLMLLDFHPGNAFIDNEGSFKLLDFGMAAGRRRPCCAVYWALRARLGCHRNPDSPDLQNVTSQVNEVVLFSESAADSDCPAVGDGCASPRRRWRLGQWGALDAFRDWLRK